MTLELRPNWREIACKLRRRYPNDSQLLKALSFKGVSVKRETLVRLRSGRHVQPRYSTGVALLQLASGV